MGAVKRFLELKIQSKIGINATVAIGLIVALLGSVVTFVFALVVAFIWLAGRYSPLTAALVIFGLFLVVAVGGAVVALIAHRNAAASAEKELAKRYLFSSRLISKPLSKLLIGLDGGDLSQSLDWDFSRLVSLGNSAPATGWSRGGS